MLSPGLKELNEKGAFLPTGTPLFQRPLPPTRPRSRAGEEPKSGNFSRGRRPRTPLPTPLTTASTCTDCGAVVVVVRRGAPFFCSFFAGFVLWGGLGFLQTPSLKDGGRVCRNRKETGRNEGRPPKSARRTKDWGTVPSVKGAKSSLARGGWWNRAALFHRARICRRPRIWPLSTHGGAVVALRDTVGSI